MTSQQPPAQPKSILRGHKAQVHSTTFLRHSQRLASGDADGFVVLWDLTIMRPRAVWRAHQSAILGIAGWGDDKVITHGRDNKLIVWKLAVDDEAALSTALPLDHAVVSDSERPKPRVLHILEVNTMNFCSFALCPARPGAMSDDELLIAVPNTLSSESVDIYHLPTQTRRHTVQFASKAAKIGMVMALSLFWLEGLTLVAAFENGHAMVARMRSSGSWDVVYKAQPHSQPILSLDVAPDKTYFLTSGADAIIAKHPIPNLNAANPSVQGNPAARKVQHPQPETKADGAASPTTTASASTSASGAGASLLSAALAAESNNDNNNNNKNSSSSPTPPAGPVKTTHTKHAGQQGLAVRRSDGRIFATAGWDGRVRVYSCKTLAELAVLRWHDVGCYAVAFADFGAEGNGEGDGKGKGEGVEDSAVAPLGGELSVKERRIKMAKETHWLAAGSKDGRISLWDIY